ncbi:hypothetical protein ACFPME_05470 [Rhodanobacter umsongensis]|uniref:Transposase n=1 Tax=Rhodanobacter umsongensis TaxID=633153 RepID=A0ABW0JIV7_9GAMM
MLVLIVDEGHEQTQAIHHRKRTRRALDGLLTREEREQGLV